MPLLFMRSREPVAIKVGVRKSFDARKLKMALLIDITPVRFSHAVKSHHISKLGRMVSFVAEIMVLVCYP